MARIKIILPIVFISIFLFSCGNNTSDENESIDSQLVVETIDTIDVSAIDATGNKEPVVKWKDYDWSNLKLLKKSTIDKINNKQGKIDQILLDFLNNYQKLVEEFNEVFYSQPDVEDLNSLLYESEDGATQNALDFKKEVENNGFSVAQAEGTLNITANSNYLKTNIIGLLDSISKSFLSLYCDEIDNICCEDAGIIIDGEEIVNRAYRWGELFKGATDKAYYKLIKKSFQWSLFLVFEGLDNTPAFDYPTEEYNKEWYELMQTYITNFPDSKAAAEFKAYCNLLKQAKFKRTDKLDEFLKNKFENIYVPEN